MISKYYYLVASLPYLRFEEEMPFSSEEFISECRKWLSCRDIEIISGINIDNLQVEARDLEIIKKWKEFNKDLKEDLASVRYIKKFHSHEKIESAYREIFQERNPLLMEKRMEKIRWNFIDECESWYDFDINLLTLYLLKLQILERLSGFNKEAGRRMFGELCEVNYG